MTEHALYAFKKIYIKKNVWPNTRERTLVLEMEE